MLKRPRSRSIRSAARRVRIEVARALLDVLASATMSARRWVSSAGAAARGWSGRPRGWADAGERRERAAGVAAAGVVGVDRLRRRRAAGAGRGHPTAGRMASAAGVEGAGGGRRGRSASRAGPQALRGGRSQPALERGGRQRLEPGVLQEREQIAVPVAPVTAIVDPDARETTLVGPGADRVGVDAQQARRATHRQGRPLGSWLDGRDLQRNR